MSSGVNKVMDVFDPETGVLLGHVPLHGAADALAALERADAARKPMAAMTAHARYTALAAAADALAERSEEAANLIAREGVKTITEARGEVGRAVGVLRASAEATSTLVGETIRFDQHPQGSHRTGWSEPVPVGVVLGITPFNDPLNLVAHKLGPAVAAGCPILLKPHEATPLSAKLIVSLVADKLPAGAVSLLTGAGADIVPALLADERVRRVSFTGGLAAGRRIAQGAGFARLTMEMGANCATIVMEDADLDRAAAALVSGAIAAAGQNCLHVQRIIAHRPILTALRDRLVAGLAAVRLGPKLDPVTEIGCLINFNAATRVEQGIKAAIAGGARQLVGGMREGTRIAPTLLDKVADADPLQRDEIFGPVSILIPAEDIDEAIARANATPFGLQGAIFTNRLDYAQRAIRELEVGAVIINETTDYRLDAMPFGGTGLSGVGREGIGAALAEMTEPKVACFTWVDGNRMLRAS